MYNADEARAKSFEVLDTKLESIFNSIKNAIDEGDLSVGVYDLETYQVERLIALKYEVTNEYCDYWLVKW
jgi:hypothetical protein